MTRRVYDGDDAAVVEPMEQRLKAFAPGFRRVVLGREVPSPRRLQLENPSLVGGDLDIADAPALRPWRRLPGGS